VTGSDILDDLSGRLGALGLRLRGGFGLVQDLDRDLLAHAPEAKTLVLVGNAGSELWQRSADAIVAMGEPDPLDRWTQQIVTPLATAICGKALFPSDGPPYWPFQRWAQRAEGVAPSPLGILIHPQYGLWHAYRAAIVLPQVLDLPPREPFSHPCDNCAEKPCLTTCPVDAFTGTRYEVDHCVRHVDATKSKSADCFQSGCQARRACPVGSSWRYQPDHAVFHMRAFLSARLAALRES
jgi:hypothetical protein